MKRHPLSEEKTHSSPHHMQLRPLSTASLPRRSSSLCTPSPPLNSQVAPPLPEIPSASPPLSFLKHLCSIVRSLSADSKNLRALSSLDSLLAKTHLFDSATGVLAVHALAHLKKLNRALSVLAYLKSRGNLSDLFLYSLVVQCLVREGNIRDVELVWAEVGGPDSLVRTNFSVFVTYICKHGSAGEIEWVYQRSLMGGGVLGRQNYMALVGALCRKNASVLAIEAVRDMEEKGLEPDYLTYLVLFQCLCRNGKLYEADLILRKMFHRRWTFDICVYGSFIHGLCKSGKFREANKLFHKLIDGDSVSSADLNLKMGRRVIFQLDCRGLVPDTLAYETYFRSLCGTGRLADAEKLLKEMMRRNSIPEVCVHNSFIKALLQVGRVDDALKFSNRLRRKNIVPAYDIAICLIVSLCEIGKFDLAGKLLEENMDKIVPVSNVGNSVLGGYWKEGRSEEAIHLFERLKSGYYGKLDGSTYVIMVNGFFDCGEVEKAILIFREMIKENFPVNGILYMALIRGLSKNGKIDEAYKYMNEMMESHNLFSYCEWKEVFYSIYCENGNELLLGF